MTSEHHAEQDRDHQDSLDQDQAMGDLDQSIANREQVLVDREQVSIDNAQDELDDELAGSDPGDLAASAHLARRQTQMRDRQARSDARQDQTDRSQLGADDLQGLFDRQQYELEQPGEPDPRDPERLLDDAAARIAATVERASNARRRAQEALRRADEAEHRALSLQLRQAQEEIPR
jgi:hypothetical protein